MIFNRRKFFGMGAAAVAAAPTIANEVASGYSNAKVYGDGVHLGSGGSSISLENKINEYAETARKLEQARRIAAGDITEEEIRHSTATKGYYEHFDSLKSVSQAGKSMLRHNRAREEWKNHLILSAKRELKRYDKYGILSSVIRVENDI